MEQPERPDQKAFGSRFFLILVTQENINKKTLYNTQS